MKIKTSFNWIRYYLNRHYPSEFHFGNKFKEALFIGIFVALFLIIFQPFESTDEEMTFKIFLNYSGYGAVTFFVQLLFSYLVEKIFENRISEENWKVKHSFFFVVTLLFFIGMGNALYESALNEDRIRLMTIIYFQLYTFAVGLFPVLFSIPLGSYYQLKKNYKISEEMNKKLRNILQTKENRRDLVIITDEKNNEFIETESDNLFFLKAASNYVEVFLKDNGQIKARLLRTSLKLVEEKLSEKDYLKRCHRAYLVNLDKIAKVTTNSQGYSIILNEGDFTLPLSRKFVGEIKNRL